MLSIALSLLAPAPSAFAPLDAVDGLRCAVVALGDVDGDGLAELALTGPRELGCGDAAIKPREGKLPAVTTRVHFSVART